MQYNCQVCDDEGLTSMAKDDASNILVVGGSNGHIRIINLKLLISDLQNPEKQGAVVMLKRWRAHVLTLSSVSYVKTHKIIMSSSKDCCIR
jgi:hypothetical protein